MNKYSVKEYGGGISFSLKTESFSHSHGLDLSDFFSKIDKTAREAAEKTELTEDEKFAICVALGAGVKIGLGDNLKAEITTAKPCNIVRIGGKWHVFILQQD